MPAADPLASLPIPPSAADWAAAGDGTAWCDAMPCGVLAVTGVDAPHFLEGQLSNQVERLSAGHWQPTSYNSPKGRMLANFILWADAGGFRVMLPAELAEPVRKRLSMFVLRSKVAIADASATTAVFGVLGPGAVTLARAVFGSAPEPHAFVRAADATLLALEGGRFLVLAPIDTGAAWRATLSAQARRVPVDVWRWATIRAGIPIVTLATQDQFVPQTANLDALGAVSFDKGCYTGQEIIARAQYLGRLKERLFRWHAEQGNVGAGTRLFSAVFGEQACGTVVNAAPAPDGGCDFLAVVQTAAHAAGEVRLSSPHGPVVSALPLPYALPEPAAPRRRL